MLVFSAFDQSDAPSSVFDISTQVITATAGQTTFTLTTFVYLPGTDTLQVYRNGLRLTSVTDYIETNSSTVTLTSPAALGDQFLFQGGAVITGDQVPGSGVSFIQAGTGAVTRNIQDKARESVSVLDFGAVGDGVTNDRAAIQAAIDSLGTAGGTVCIPNGMKCLIDLNGLVVKPNVSLVGPHKFVGSPNDNSSAPYNDVGGTIILDAGTAGVSIYLNGGASVSGLLIYRKGMTFPQTSVAGWTGTAIVATDDDVAVQNCMILGFNKGFYSSGHQRPRLTSVYMDNINCVEIAACYDIAYLFQCHCWPFATIANGTPLIRSGTAYHFRDGGDWNKITNCFSYGYFRGLVISNANSITATGCGFDNVPGGHPNSIGIIVTNGCEDTKLISCQTAAHATAGVLIDNLSGSIPLVTIIQNHSIWGGSTHGILIYNGDAIINGCSIRDVTNVVTITSSASRVIFDDSWVKNIAQTIVNATVATTNVTLGNNNIYTNFGGDPTGNLTLLAIASASVVLLSSTGSQFYITGTTNIGTFLHAWAGRVVTLIFTGALTVIASGTGVGSIRLNNNANFTTQTGSTLTLVGVGGESWIEIGRCF